MRFNRSPFEFPRECSTNDVFTLLKTIMETQEFIMAAIDDLTTAVNAAVATMGAAVTAIGELRTNVGNGQGVSDAQLEGLASQLTTAQTGLQAAVTPPAAAPADAAPAAPADPAPAA